MKNLREVFLNEGIDEQVIQEFKEVCTYVWWPCFQDCVCVTGVGTRGAEGAAAPL